MLAVSVPINISIKFGVVSVNDPRNLTLSHCMTNVSIPEVNMLKNSSMLAVSVPINICIKLGFVSVNIPRETYVVDALHISIQSQFLILYSFPSHSFINLCSCFVILDVAVKNVLILASTST